jgi:hypothetical protein
MSGKGTAGLPRGNPSLREQKAYAEGRLAAVNGGSAGDNPHPANSPASDAWLRGFSYWEEGGIELMRDGTAYPITLAPRGGVKTKNVSDASGRTYDVELSIALPTMVDFGDGEWADTPTGQATHSYPERDGSYVCRWYADELEVANTTVDVTYVAP